MSDLKQDGPKQGESGFLTEKVKMRPVNKKKLVRRIVLTAAMAVIFGLVACVTFLLLEPVISNWLYPEKKPQFVAFPEDQEEMSPEDMLAENLPEESSGSEDDSEETYVELGEAQIRSILSRVELDIKNYQEINAALTSYVDSMSNCMVTVTAFTSSRDWLNDVQESRNQCSGLILEDNGMELLILTDYSTVRTAERLIVTFYDDEQVEAQVKAHDTVTDLAVVAVNLDDLSYLPEEERPPIASLGSSNIKNLPGTSVVAVGSPMGVSGSVGFGMITSPDIPYSLTDRNYKLMLTDIVGSADASGVLFNLQGQVIGVITDSKTGVGMDNMIRAYGVTELKKIIENMSNEVKTPYLGISGGDVPGEAHQLQGVPLGAYVREIAFDSPTLRAGIQRGDIVVGMGGRRISTFSGYTGILMEKEAGETVEVTVMRMVRDEYKEMSFNIVLGEVK